MLAHFILSSNYISPHYQQDLHYLTVLYIFCLQIIREKINQSKDVLIKSCEVDLVTEWDQKVERLLIDGISSKHPDHR